jgi:hypothetical protein
MLEEKEDPPLGSVPPGSSLADCWHPESMEITQGGRPPCILDALLQGLATNRVSMLFLDNITPVHYP